MKIQKTAFLMFLLVQNFLSKGQITYNANTQAPTFTQTFRVGFNFGDDYNWGAFTDQKLAKLAANIGATSARPTLPEDFLNTWGYGIRVDAFNYYHDSLGMRDLNVIALGPSAAKRETTTYPCGANPSVQSELFANLYQPVWDANNGTPINEHNYYAAYLYNLVNTYKDYVTFWEIWNEVGFDYSYWYGWQKRGVAGNWWENNPNPCDYKLRAPIFHYIHMLRISYDIVKTLDPTALVCPSSFGYPSFLDAVLRNTDNPVDGSVTPQYPLKGGAYFDAIGHHAYPHFDNSVRRRDSTDQFWQYFRHSDGAAEGIGFVIHPFDTVYKWHGYDGLTFPKKKWLITEMNVPRIAFNPNLWGSTFDCGGVEFQRNFIPKAYVTCAKRGIMQWNIWQLGERHHNPPREEFDVMGLYRYLDNPETAVPNDEAWSLKTTSTMLFKKSFDSLRSVQMKMPTAVDGAAFKDSMGNYTYIIWAKTTVDKSETAVATYSFPDSLGIISMTKREWNNSQTGISSTIAAQNIALTGAPIFLTPSVLIPIELISFKGQAKNGQHILRWQTASEINSNFFEIEKSLDSKIFKPIGKVKAEGQSATPQYYSLVDESPSVGVNYYRLKMVDNDGSSKYSRIVALASVAKFSAIAFPNPFDKTLTINVQDTEGGYLELELSDLAGRVFIQKAFDLKPGNAFSIHTDMLPSGVYLLKMTVGETVILQKIVK